MPYNRAQEQERARAEDEDQTRRRRVGRPHRRRRSGPSHLRGRLQVHLAGARRPWRSVLPPAADRHAASRSLRALGAHGVVFCPGQRIDTQHLAAFGRMFGELEIKVANQFHEPGFPEVMVLSNMAAHGKPIGLADAGQGWHTDMSYSTETALANVLYAVKVPMREGRSLGETQFRNMHAT